MYIRGIFTLIGFVLSSICFTEMKSNSAAAGPGVELIITPYTTTFFSDGKDVAEIMVRVVDVAGQDVSNIEATLRIKVQGNGSIVPDKNRNIGKFEIKKQRRVYGKHKS